MSSEKQKSKNVKRKADKKSSEMYVKSNHVNFTVVQENGVEEGSTDDEGEDGLDLSNLFDDVPQDTDTINDTIDALDQHLFTPVTPSPIPDRSTTTKDKPTEKSVGTLPGRPIGSPQGSNKQKIGTPHHQIVNYELESSDSDPPVTKYRCKVVLVECFWSTII